MIVAGGSNRKPRLFFIARYSSRLRRKLCPQSGLKHHVQSHPPHPMILYPMICMTILRRRSSTVVPLKLPKLVPQLGKSLVTPAVVGYSGAIKKTKGRTKAS